MEVEHTKIHRSNVLRLSNDSVVTSLPPAPDASEYLEKYFGVKSEVFTLESNISSTHHQLSNVLSFIPLWLLEVDSARDHRNQVFLRCGDPAVTSPPPLPSTPEYQIWYSEFKNELCPLATFQRAIAHAIVAIGSGW